MPGGGHVNAEEIIPLLRSLTDAGMSETQARIVAEQQAHVHKRCHQKNLKTPRYS